MRELLDELEVWWTDELPFAVATVVGVTGSAPRQVGASMALSALGQVVGSVSGGCVEAAVHDAAKHVLSDGEPRLLHFGPYDELGEPGLTCGGSVEILVRAVDRERFPDFSKLVGAVRAQRPIALVTELATGRHRLLRPDQVQLTRCDEQRVHVDTFAPAPQMLVFGAVDYAAALARIGRFLGFHVTVCDARPAFATAARFPDAHRVVVSWPDRLIADTAIDDRTVICVLTHDPKFDVPALTAALATPAAFVGAMGSRHTHLDRLDRLREAGVTEEQLARLHSPIGLDLGARTPEETAVSIAAEIVASRWGGTGRPLAELTAPIHH
jgi:xanthine dehydrogenase accessory factor